MAEALCRREALRRSDFERAKQSGFRVSSALFIAVVMRRQGGERARLGITVTRKVGNAVRRNRIKRLVREWFRLRSGGLGPCDVVVIAKRDIPRQVGCSEVVRDLDRAWSRVRTCELR
jgi:ribonuclease P protein component